MTSGNPYKRPPHYFLADRGNPKYCDWCLLKETAPVHISTSIHEQEVYAKPERPNVDPLADIRAQLAAEADEIPKRIKRRLLDSEDPFPPERHKGNRATVAYYDEADLVVRGNLRHARARVGIFKKLRNEYQDLKKYVNLSKGDKIVLGSVALLQVIYITVNVIVALN